MHVRHLHLRGDVNVAVKVFAHCETVTVLVDGSCLLDLGPDHSPSPHGLLRLLKGTRLRQLTVELLNPVRWAPRLVASCCQSMVVVMGSHTELSQVLVELPSGGRHCNYTAICTAGLDITVGLPEACKG